jgi:hypothetical protein
MDEPGIKRTRAPRWALRSMLLVGLVGGVLVPMATLAIASTGPGPTSAIRTSTLDRMLHPGAVPVPLRTVEGT